MITEISTTRLLTTVDAGALVTVFDTAVKPVTTISIPGRQGARGISIVPYVSDTPPDPDEHPLWLNSTTSVLYFWYEDADSGQWVSIAGGSSGTDGLDAPAYERRHDYASPYSYCGKAPDGSLDADSVWTITRIELASDGTTTVTNANDAAWDDRLTATYG